MLVTIDIGNTNQTYSIFKDSQLESSGSLDNLPQGESDIIVSSVNDSKLNLIHANYTSIRNYLKNSKFGNMPVHYSSSIGDDRIICAYYLYNLNQSSKVLIDTGSFTTIDFINEDGYQGGHILPGLNLIQESYQAGENLKHISTDIKDLNSTTSPSSTEEAIQNGVLLSFIAPIKNIIEQLNPSEIYITGGNKKLLQKYLDNKEIKLEDSLVHKSLFFFYEENLK